MSQTTQENSSFFVIIHNRSGFTLNPTQNYHQSYFKACRKHKINDNHFLYVGWACGHTVHDWEIRRSSGFQTICHRHRPKSTSVLSVGYSEFLWVSKWMIWIFQDKCHCQSTLNNWDNSKVFLGWWFRRQLEDRRLEPWLLQTLLQCSWARHQTLNPST